MDDVILLQHKPTENDVVGLDPCPVPLVDFDKPLPPPQPPPLAMHVTDVLPHVWMHNKQQPVLQPYVVEKTTASTSQNKSTDKHLLWKTFMFPTLEEKLCMYDTESVLRILQEHDSAHFSQETTLDELCGNHFRLLQANGGANTSVTNDQGYRSLQDWWGLR